ncbi:unnamed protein product [Phytomonas sp. Hart1]|nr:unnamed protein product [Phytomonas sp. Hart1]|eukprot:CCW70885.1 unnamed protein product [Phytomonas sp. isolate Hart1]
MEISKKIWAAKEWARVKASGNEFLTLVHEATNDEKWGPTGQQMEYVCRAFPRGTTEIMDEITRRLKHRDKSWRSCYKSLLLLDYLARNLSDGYLPEISALVPLLRTISQSFYYTNGKGVDHGISVRERARNLAGLLSDGFLLSQEREKSAQTKAKLLRDMPNGSSVRINGGRYEESHGGFTYPFSSEGYGDYSGYDQHHDSIHQLSHVTRTKSEQELFDMEMALRLQREEERRSGMSVSQIEKIYCKHTPNNRFGENSSQKQSHTTDEQLAQRLQNEELQKAEAQEPSPKRSYSKPTPPTAAVAESKTQSKSGPISAEPSAPPEVSQSNILDDLFSSSPPPAVAAGPKSVEDLFGVFPGGGVQTRATTSAPEPQTNAQAQGAVNDPWKQVPTLANAWAGPYQGGAQPQNYVEGKPQTVSVPQQSSWQPTPPQGHFTNASTLWDNDIQWVQAPMPMPPQGSLKANAPISKEASAPGNMLNFPSF